MDKIIYKNITINDDMVLILQALIDNQAKIVDFINGLSDIANDSNLYEEIDILKTALSFYLDRGTNDQCLVAAQVLWNKLEWDKLINTMKGV